MIECESLPNALPDGCPRRELKGAFDVEWLEWIELLAECEGRPSLSALSVVWARVERQPKPEQAYPEEEPQCAGLGGVDHCMQMMQWQFWPSWLPFRIAALMGDMYFEYELGLPCRASFPMMAVSAALTSPHWRQSTEQLQSSGWSRRWGVCDVVVSKRQSWRSG